MTWGFLALSHLSTKVSLNTHGSTESEQKPHKHLTGTWQQLVAMGGISIIFCNNETELAAQWMTFSLLVAQLNRGRCTPRLPRSKEVVEPAEY